MASTTGAKSGRRYNWLLTEKTYSDFLLRFECQLRPIDDHLAAAVD